MSTGRTRLIALGALAAGVVAILLVAGGGGGGHRFSAVVPAAHNLIPTQRINAAGKNIGKVEKIEPVDGGRAAKLQMRIDDDDYWPLPRDSRIEIRYGGTVSFSSRYLSLTRGTRTNDVIPEGGQLASSNVKVPYEVDELLPRFDPRTRTDLRRMIDKSAGFLERSAPDLQRLLGRSGPLTEEAGGVFEDLASNREALRALVRSTGRVVDAVDRSNPDIRVLLEGAAQTFDAIASESGELKVALTRFPQALRQTRSTLTRADVTLREAGDLTRRIGPGVTELRRTAGPLTETMASLRKAVPGVRGVLEKHPAIDTTAGLLYRLRNNSKRFTSIAKQAKHEIGCVRPWSPEIALFATTWADWLSPVDKRDHYLRATVQNFLPANYNSVPLTPGQASKIFPGMDYGFPRPPGHLAGQPWFQPQCGVGPDSIDPSKDQEAIHFGNGDELPPDMRPRKGAGR